MSDFANGAIALLQANADTLGIAEGGIFYSDQLRIPVTPSVCVEPVNKNVELKASSRMTKVVITIYLLVYHSEVRNVELNRSDADLLAESIAKVFNADGTFGGTCIHNYITDITSGYSTKVSNTMRTTRLTWEITTQELLPNNP
jgi:hypothetical protein